ncbi:DegT/DnrJ/EryC1/StrS family aminotransferase [Arvimicrobium flavum]|uniref:DegT/DnrJ/EryC1/StrS family aminotransferase n=1 Tax=Arvimicrobium flavum TaxID=3393320 RepID=UPI00237B53CA|nr:DegT/DnrJ/EryC1/StrS family aminotransferase [Mesorhizobium shangrilense]
MAAKPLGEPETKQEQEQLLSARIPVAAPVLDGREAEYVAECIETEWISSNGRFISAFESAFAEFCGVKHAIAVNNGTTALHLALVALGIEAGDEVIVPTLTYIASANCVRYCNAVPVLVDSDRQTMNMDPAKVAAAVTPKTKAIIPVHLYGHPVDMDPLREIADKHGLFLVEDAAEAIGASYKDKRVGGLGHCATFSFFGNKIITTGEGGMVTTDDDELAAKLRLFKGQGMDPNRRYWFNVVGYNYRMTNVAAAIGLAQMERVDQHLSRRAQVASAYNAKLSALADFIELPVTANWATHSHWMYVITLKDSVAKSRDAVMAALDKENIETRPVFYPMHHMPPYQEDRTYPIAEHLSARGINLPTHGRMTERDIDRVVDALRRAVID